MKTLLDLQNHPFSQREFNCTPAVKEIFGEDYLGITYPFFLIEFQLNHSIIQLLVPNQGEGVKMITQVLSAAFHNFGITYAPNTFVVKEKLDLLEEDIVELININGYMLLEVYRHPNEFFRAFKDYLIQHEGHIM